MILLALTAFAQDSGLFTVKLAWDVDPAAEHFRGENANGEPVFIHYFVRHSTNITATNWPVAAVTTNHAGGVAISNLSVSSPHFFTVTASNFFLGKPSEVLGVPAPGEPVENTHFIEL